MLLDNYIYSAHRQRFSLRFFQILHSVGRVCLSACCIVLVILSFRTRKKIERKLENIFFSISKLEKIFLLSVLNFEESRTPESKIS